MAWRVWLLFEEQGEEGFKKGIDMIYFIFFFFFTFILFFLKDFSV